jgi:hypothetical protein
MADLGNLSAVREHEVEVVPIRATLPSLEVLEEGEDARLRAGVDRARGGELRAAEFGSFQEAS